MTKEYFEQNVIMAIEIEYEDGGRHWNTMKGSEVEEYLDRLEHDEGRYLSDIDYCSKQNDPEIGKIIDAAIEIWRDKEKSAKFKNLDDVIDSLLVKTSTKKTWTEEEIKNLIQVNDKVLYGALKKLYACQTAEEQNDKETHEQNGKGFNGVDAPILSSFCEFLNKTGFLTQKQKVLARKKLVKYNKQLTVLANA